MRIKERLRHAWNAFTAKDSISYTPTGYSSYNRGLGLSRYSMSQASLASTVFNRISIDCSMIDLVHVKEDTKTGNQIKFKYSDIQKVLRDSANLDETGIDFLHDLVYSLLDEGVVAVVPTETSRSIITNDSFKIYSIRVAKIVQWFPNDIRVSLYNEKVGHDQEITLPKANVAIINNPLYGVINERNSTLRRLLRKIEIGDHADDALLTSKINLILQMPMVLNNEKRVKEADERIEKFQKQLEGDNQYGVAYVDGSEKITQLNRPVTNNLLDEIQYLTKQFYNQVGLTENIFNGTADETEMRAYYNRTIDPIMRSITSEFNRKFFTDAALTQGQRIIAYRDPFKLVPVEQLAQIADTFTRNAILTPNEVRGIIGFPPNSNPDADELANRNIADVNQNPSDTPYNEVKQYPDSDNGGDDSMS